MNVLGNYFRVEKGASGVYIGVCDKLNITVQGESLSDLGSACEEAVLMLREEDEDALSGASGSPEVPQ